MVSYRVLITGSRDWINADIIQAALGYVIREKNELGFPTTLVHGGARGADALAEKLAKDIGWTIERHPAQWEQFGESAGYRRNAEMANLGADICLAFIKNNSKGATMMVDLAEKKHIPTYVWREDG